MSGAAPPLLAARQRILIVGSGGAGKSTFARELAARTELPLIHLDRYFWKPGWVPTPQAEWTALVERLTRDERWIMDGSFTGSLKMRLSHCDAVVFFDFPRLICLRGVLQRHFAHRTQARPDLADGCPERLDATFLRWVWRYPRDTRPRVVAALAEAGKDVEIVTVKRRAQARSILDALGEGKSTWPPVSLPP